MIYKDRHVNVNLYNNSMNLTLFASSYLVCLHFFLPFYCSLWWWSSIICKVNWTSITDSSHSQMRKIESVVKLYKRLIWWYKAKFVRTRGMRRVGSIIMIIFFCLVLPFCLCDCIFFELVCLYVAIWMFCRFYSFYLVF